MPLVGALVRWPTEDQSYQDYSFLGNLQSRGFVNIHIWQGLICV